MNKPMLVLGNISLTSIPAVIVKAFEPFESKMIKLNDVNEFQVIDDDSANLANIKLKEIVALENEIEEKRKEIKEPINFIASAIQDEARKYSTDLGTAKSILNKKVTDYKNLLLARLAAEEERKRLEAEADIARKEKIVKRIANILIQFRTMLFGGEMRLKDGTMKPVSKPETVEDLDKIKNMVLNIFPNLDMFEEFRSDIAVIKENFLNDIEKYKIHIINNDQSAIKDMLLKYNKACNIADEKIEKVVLKEEKKIEQEIKSEYASAAKGIREWMKFTVVNKTEVPDNYKVVDEVLVNNYIRANKEKVMDAIKSGKADQLLPGIQFYIEKRHVIR